MNGEMQAKSAAHPVIVHFPESSSVISVRIMLIRKRSSEGSDVDTDKPIVDCIDEAVGKPIAC